MPSTKNAVNHPHGISQPSYHHLRPPRACGCLRHQSPEAIRFKEPRELADQLQTHGFWRLSGTANWAETSTEGVRPGASPQSRQNGVTRKLPSRVSQADDAESNERSAFKTCQRDRLHPLEKRFRVFINHAPLGTRRTQPTTHRHLASLVAIARAIPRQTSRSRCLRHAADTSRSAVCRRHS